MIHVIGDDLSRESWQLDEWSVHFILVNTSTYQSSSSCELLRGFLIKACEFMVSRKM